MELHPEVDTIIEIGGQDSKFTTLRNGRVTLSVMNNVCAAGTGSFIEEQARRLEVPLSEYGERTSGCGSPIASERCTVFMERDLNHYLGEVITTPYTSYVKMIVRLYYWKWILEGKYVNALSTGALMAGFVHLEKRYFRQFQRILRESDPVYDSSPQAILSEYNVSVVHTGEAMDNLLKVFYIVRHHPDVALFVQASPAFCCPPLVTEAMAHEIERKTGVPMVSVTYDGTGGTKNEVILPYLEYPRANNVVPCQVPA